MDITLSKYYLNETISTIKIIDLVALRFNGFLTYFCVKFNPTVSTIYISAKLQCLSIHEGFSECKESEFVGVQCGGEKNIYRYINIFLYMYIRICFCANTSHGPKRQFMGGSTETSAQENELLHKRTTLFGLPCESNLRSRTPIKGQLGNTRSV